MYRYGENHIKRRHRNIALLCIVAIAVVAGVIAATKALHTSTTIAPAPAAITKNVSAPTVKTKPVDEPLFSISLPTDWEQQSHTSSPNIYTWINTAHNKGVQSLSLYIDSPQPKLGVNHALYVRADGDHVTPLGDVSDNCASFTGANPNTLDTATPAKWNGVDFLCDLGNYNRDVVGTVAQDGINRVSLTGDSQGAHDLFFTYTDNNIQADYSVFIAALQSFRLK